MQRTQRTHLIALILLGGCATTKLTADPRAVDLAGALSNTHLAASRASELSARIHIDVHALENVPRPPVNIALAIDTSGSMEGAAIKDARDAALALLDSLSEGDQLALVTFDSEARVLVPATKIHRAELAELREQINAMKASGTTELAAGLSAALGEVARGIVPSGVNRIVLLSDGIPNTKADFNALAESARSIGVAITALGLGLDYDETLLAALAAKSGGSFHFIEDSSMVAGIFKDEVLQLKRVIAKNSALALKPGPGVNVATISGPSSSTGADRTVYAQLGDLSENDTRDIFIELSIEGRRAGASVELIDAVFSYDDPRSQTRVDKRIFLSARSTSDAAEVEKHENRELKIAAAKAKSASWTVDAIALARGGRPNDARLVLERAEEQVTEWAVALQATELADEVKSMSLVREALPTYAESPESAKNIRRLHERASNTVQGY